MAEALVIVESPAKAKTIGKYLGSKYKVIASNGHIRDLPKSQLGVDVEHGFAPKYITLRGRGDVLENIRREAKEAKTIYLATDPDREGEAISWHLAEILKLDPGSKCRIEFNEITSAAVKGSLKKVRSINMDLVDAQQARRVLDRLVGYKISPILWAKVRKGLSAGRVQSVATRIICDREEEINDFVPQEYWVITALLGEKKGFEAAQQFVDETVCRLRYGNMFVSAKVNYGTEFYLYDASELRNRYKLAKESGASEAELDALQNQIIETEYRNNPTQLQRMLILAELEPYRHLTRPEVLELYEKQLITEDELRIKLNFANFVRRFERENTNVLEFGSQIPFSKKIEVITKKIYDYASESRNRG